MAQIVRGDQVEKKYLKDNPRAKPTSSKTDYIGAGGTLSRGAQAFMNDVREPYEIKPHFHLIDQFQIFVRAPVKIGKSWVDPVAVHYADAYTPYGPILAGDEGYTFFNLRARGDVGAHWMPGARDEMPRRAGRHRTAQCELADPARADFPVRSFLIEPEEDGLSAFTTVAGAGKRLPDDVAGGSGCYELVLAGSLELDDQVLPESSLLFADAGERLPSRRAGSDGVVILTAQLPVD